MALPCCILRHTTRLALIGAGMTALLPPGLSIPIRSLFGMVVVLLLLLVSRACAAWPDDYRQQLQVYESLGILLSVRPRKSNVTYVPAQGAAFSQSKPKYQYRSYFLSCCLSCAKLIRMEVPPGGESTCLRG